MVYDVFFIIGAVLIVGFFTSQIFERTKFPDILLLMFIGILLGPVLNLVSIEGAISSLAPYIGILALIIMLFDGGLNLNLVKVLTTLAKASGFTVLVFTMTVASLGIFMHFIFNWSYLEGMLLGAVVGGTSSAIVMSIISKLTIDEEPKVLLSLESALTDALCIVVAIALIEIISLGTMDVRNTGSSIASAFSTAAVIGAIFAIVWIGLLKKLYVKQVGYSLTLAVVFILYSVVELVRGNGAIAVLVFALLLGNFGEISKRLRVHGEFALDPTLRAFQVEVSFFVRTFFFIFTGLMFNLESMRSTALTMALAVFGIILLTRIIGVKLLVFRDRNMAHNEKAMISMMPRGLAAAVLASMPLAAGIIIPYFVEIVFSIIILTNMATAFGIFAVERKLAENARIAIQA